MAGRFGRVAGGHRALALRVEPALRSPSADEGRLSIPRAGTRGTLLRSIPLGRRPHPLGAATALQPPCASRSRLRRPCSARRVCRFQQRHGALGARRPLPVSVRAQHRSPDFFAFSANAKPGPRQGALAFYGGIHKASPYKASPLRKPIPVPLMARRRTQGNGASKGRLHGQQTTVDRL